MKRDKLLRYSWHISAHNEAAPTHTQQDLAGGVSYRGGKNQQLDKAAQTATPRSGASSSQLPFTRTGREHRKHALERLLNACLLQNDGQDHRRRDSGPKVMETDGENQRTLRPLPTETSEWRWMLWQFDTTSKSLRRQRASRTDGCQYGSVPGG